MAKTMKMTFTELMKETFQTSFKEFENKLSQDEKQIFKSNIKKNIDDEIEIKHLQTLLKYTKISKNSNIKYFHELVAGSKIFHPVIITPPKDPKLVKRLAELRAQQENRMYQKMVRNITDTREIRRIKDSMEMKDFKGQMGVGINIIATMFTTFVGGWFFGRSYFYDDVLGLCCGLVLCIIGMLIEMWLFVINGSNLDDHLEKQKKKKRKGESVILPDYQGLVCNT